MSPLTFVFVGRSGCGKGTQSELLQKHLKEKEPSSEIFYLETGSHFREFVSGEKYSNKLSDKIYKSGGRQPDFLAVWMWANVILDGFKGTEHLFLDGICRSLPEAMTFTTAMEFYNREVCVIYLNVSREWSEARLFSRGRMDDINKTEVKKRLDWFDKDAAPAIDYFNIHSKYTLLTINGEQSIEDVHKEIIQKLGW
ncbi:MAG: nucleoside monophosphate kinase [Candidatus Zambryskibacteria bacterium]|nr:nucleoside monophosphate kinase [Candidatus Zambryskibacteria bacterium]